MGWSVLDSEGSNNYATHENPGRESSLPLPCFSATFKLLRQFEVADLMEGGNAAKEPRNGRRSV